jgi:hypothetical protein
MSFGSVVLSVLCAVMVAMLCLHHWHTRQTFEDQATIDTRLIKDAAERVHEAARTGRSCDDSDMECMLSAYVGAMRARQTMADSLLRSRPSALNQHCGFDVQELMRDCDALAEDLGERLGLNEHEPKPRRRRK